MAKKRTARRCGMMPFIIYWEYLLTGGIPVCPAPFYISPVLKLLVYLPFDVLSDWDGGSKEGWWRKWSINLCFCYIFRIGHAKNNTLPLIIWLQVWTVLQWNCFKRFFFHSFTCKLISTLSTNSLYLKENLSPQSHPAHIFRDNQGHGTLKFIPFSLPHFINRIYHITPLTLFRELKKATLARAKSNCYIR